MDSNTLRKVVASIVAGAVLLTVLLTILFGAIAGSGPKSPCDGHQDFRQADGSADLTETYIVYVKTGAASSITQSFEDVYTMQGNGENLTRVLASVPFVTALAPSPDGDRIALGGLSGVSIIIGEDGTNLRGIAPARKVSSLSWSPDGEHLAWVDKGSLVVADAPGFGHQLQIAPQLDAHGVAWSADGRRIAFIGNQEVFTSDPEGRQLVQLTFDSLPKDSVAWSPDGSRIAYAAGVARFTTRGEFESVADGDIYVLGVDDGGESSNLSRSPGINEQQPRWSPDGSLLAYISQDHGSDVFVMRPDGSEQQRLGSGLTAVWSPDGRWIASYLQGDIYVISPATTDVFCLDRTAAGHDLLDWVGAATGQ